MNDIFSDAFDRLLDGACSPAQVRAIEAGGPTDALWAAVTEGGFADLLVAEDSGGAGLSLLDAAPLIAACGRGALPLPLAYTMLARAAAHSMQHSAAASASSSPSSIVPDGPVTIAPSSPLAVEGVDGGLRCNSVPFAAVSQWVVVTHRGVPAWWPTAAATLTRDGIRASLDGDLNWAGVPADVLPLQPGIDWRTLGAGLTALLMAGAMERVLEMTIQYANDRTQFGRPIGKFQALQQQISVFAERTFATRMASRIACPSRGWLMQAAAVAVGKGYASEAVADATAIAHAVHGAIGITAEHDLNLYTRRLHAWRLAYGAESSWYAALGGEWLSSDRSALDFMLEHLSRDVAEASP